MSRGNHTNEHFPTFELRLPENRLLIGHNATRTLSLLSGDAERPVSAVMAQKRFTPREWAVLRLLIQSYPYAVPYDDLYAAMHKRPLEGSRQHLLAARQRGRLREELRPLRDAISSLRGKLQSFALGIAFQHDVGYILIIQRPQRRRPP